MFALPITHCVDDIIGVEPSSLAVSGNLAFKLLCEATGWKVSIEKSPQPAGIFQVIGVELDLSEVPEKEAVLKVTARRIEQLTKTIQLI